ncbi:hypothetical protein [Ruegeria sp. Alg231-54]|uniref:hypothetical protein n=1 Tax=Ruegeria sp. Alg231-54 TaxID=1922221 RepID=UPI000D55260C|nr:hypothetical protein [Ruegeria sp. Alg231-54]
MTNSFDVKSSWVSVMDETKNPLKKYSLSTAHMLMQMLAWMWSAIFSLMVGSYFVFGVTALGHLLLIGGLFVTLAVFQKAEGIDPEA